MQLDSKDALIVINFGLPPLSFRGTTVTRNLKKSYHDKISRWRSK